MASSTWSVRFEEVSKRYRKGGAAYPTLGAAFGSMRSNIRSRLSGERVELRGKLALDNVSFEVQRGESFALIGPNGAGKTTALKLLARISPPTSGWVRGRGRVGALMEVGSGVHTELSGRENIWLYGSILGIRRAEIRRRFDEIVAFAELEHAIDTQVKYFSSGMQLRLGFAIASHLEPDIFVVDEALSVGDASFQERCVERMGKLIESGTTVLFVSHNLAAVESVCDRGILIDHGRAITEGPVKEVLSRYLKTMEERRVDLSAGANNQGVVRIESATCHALDGTEQSTFSPGDGMEIRMKFVSTSDLERPNVSVGITDGLVGALVECSMLEDGLAPASVGREWECRLRIESLPLRPRLYQVWADVQEETGRGLLMEWLEIASFRVDAPAGAGPQGVVMSALGGPIKLPYTWDVRS